MKWSYFFPVIAFLLVFNANAQSIKVGAIFGLPTSDASDFSDFVIGADAYYIINENDALLEFGSTFGIRNYFVDAEGVDDALFLPLGGAARVKILGLLRGGVDVGYALGLSDGLDGGFYFRPVLGIINLLNLVEVNISYESISSDDTWANINLGALIRF